jgi:hypothetical protein
MMICYPVFGYFLPLLGVMNFLVFWGNGLVYDVFAWILYELFIDILFVLKVDISMVGILA